MDHGLEGERVSRDYLAEILARKRVEVARRRRHAAVLARTLEGAPLEPRGERAVASLRRRPGEPLRVIAEVKFASPSAGVIRAHAPGARAGVAVARAYVEGGASAISVLADGPGFGGSALEVRRVATAVSVPVLFKEFVLDDVQIALARAAGASLVLLLVRALPGDELARCIDAVRSHGMEPVVEAADAAELEVALATSARIVGVNARDLRTFKVDSALASEALARVPADRVAVFMSGVRSREDFLRLDATRADAVLVGESLMREADPRAKLRELRGLD